MVRNFFKTHPHRFHFFFARYDLWHIFFHMECLIFGFCIGVVGKDSHLGDMCHVGKSVREIVHLLCIELWHIGNADFDLFAEGFEIAEVIEDDIV